MTKPDIAQLFDLAKLQRLLEAQHRMTGVPVALLDAEEHVLAAVGWQDACTRFHRRHPITLARCRESDAWIKAHLGDCPGGYVDYRCQNGLRDVAMPLFLEGRHLVTLFTGQFFYDDEPPDLDFFRSQAAECGFDEGDYLAAVRRVPVVSREHIRHVMEYFRCLVEIIAETGMKNLRLAVEIEERKKSEQEAAFFRNLVENIQDPVYVLDPDDGFRMVYVNRAACRHYGQEREAVLRMRIPDWDPVFDMADTEKLHQQMQQHTEVRFETIHQDASGRLIPVEVSTSLLVEDGRELVAGFFHDISERKAMETDLRESKRNLLEAQRIARVGNWSWSLDGRLQSASRECRRILGMSSDRPVDDEAALLERIHGPDRERVKLAYEGLLKDHRPCSVEYRFHRPDGEEVTIHEQREMLFDDDGRPVGLIGTIQDITEQLELLESLREKDLLLMQQSRMAAMGEMISYIAHQWRQPLHIISLLVQSLDFARENGGSRSRCGAKAVEQVMDLIEHMASTIDDFRDFFHTDKEKSPFDLKQAIERIVALIAADMKMHRIEVLFDAEDSMPAMGFANEFSHVLLNILNNAKDALLEQRVDARRIHIRLFREGPKQVVTIRDNAGGIPVDSCERLFDAYFTTKPSGTGIGLYISKIIVEKRLEGTLSVRNVDSGAEFRIEL